MEKWKKIGKKLLFPPVWLIVILTVLTAIFVPLTYIMGWDGTPIAYGIYVVAFYAVTVLTLYLSCAAKALPADPPKDLRYAIAGGDFSAYIPPQHSGDKLDYVDTMFMDFNKMVEELGSIETLKTDFFANVSHEIKTPLAAIQNSAELLQRDSCTEEQRKEHSENIIHASKRLSNLITNMLKLNKLDRQVIKPTPAPYDLCAQLCECAFQLEDMWERTYLFPLPLF